MAFAFKAPTDTLPILNMRYWDHHYGEGRQKGFEGDEMIEPHTVLVHFLIETQAHTADAYEKSLLPLLLKAKKEVDRNAAERARSAVRRRSPQQKRTEWQSEADTAPGAWQLALVARHKDGVGSDSC